MRMPPGPDGVWAPRTFASSIRHIEIAVCTAYSDIDPTDIGGRVPPEDKLSYLQKPFHPHEVRQMAIALASKWRAERHIARLAYFDSLTGLPNREQAHNRLRSALAARAAAAAACWRSCTWTSTTSSASTTRSATRSAMKCWSWRPSACARRCVQRRPHARDVAVDRPGDLGRLGGDEFMLVLPDIGSSENAAQVADRLITTLQEPMRLSKHTVVITPSIGIAMSPTDGHDADTLLRHADLAMYFAKRRAPGTYAFFDASMNEGALQRYTIEGKLRGALERGELSLHYQPQIDMATGHGHRHGSAAALDQR